MFATELYAIDKQCHETIVCGVMRLVGMHKVAEGIRADGEMHVTGPILAHSVRYEAKSLFFSETLCWVCLLGLVTSSVVQSQYWHYTSDIA